jgi:hypothetical protein
MKLCNFYYILTVKVDLDEIIIIFPDSIGKSKLILYSLSVLVITSANNKDIITTSSDPLELDSLSHLHKKVDIQLTRVLDQIIKLLSDSTCPENYSMCRRVDYYILFSALFLVLHNCVPISHPK